MQLAVKSFALVLLWLNNILFSLHPYFFISIFIRENMPVYALPKNILHGLSIF
jgi:hypothetical protein